MQYMVGKGPPSGPERLIYEVKVKPCIVGEHVEDARNVGHMSRKALGTKWSQLK